ncbi:hypothetical protein [Myxosarcina sp. GI1]|uniref:hypothetical protein n=1 Tax=Myxosarcina sp. GI1 TaxID=1541065 RepID=UPI0012E0C1B2|nr:hypothetical protein [Myxosarcina sp. GI1]
MNLSIDPELKDGFKALCKRKGINVTDAVQNWMRASITAKDIIAQPKTITLDSDGSLPPSLQEAVSEIQQRTEAKFEEAIAKLTSKLSEVEEELSTVKK